LSGYVDEQRLLDFVDYDKILVMVGSRRAYRGFIMDGLNRGFESPFKNVRSRMILGDDDFASSVKRYLRRVSSREQPAYREMITVTLKPEVVLDVLRREFGIGRGVLELRGTNGLLRGIVAELLYKYSDITQAEIGQLLGGIDYMAVSLLRKRLRAKMDQDKEIRKKYNELEARINKSM
jgi:hypothetical protein